MEAVAEEEIPKHPEVEVERVPMLGPEEIVGRCPAGVPVHYQH